MFPPAPLALVSSHSGGVQKPKAGVLGSHDSATGAPDTAPDPTAIATGAADAKDKAAGGKPHAGHDKTKVPVETAMWTKMRPIMHGLGDFTDAWERFAK